MLANLDRVIVGGRGILECKTTARTEGWGPSGSDEIPLTYYLQLVHYLAVTDSPFADLAVVTNEVCRRLAAFTAHPAPATHSILTLLKAGETVYQALRTT